MAGAYCFGDLTPEERNAYEAHLLDCDQCWAEMERFDAAVVKLRTDRSILRDCIGPRVIGLFGLSGRLGRPFGGHIIHVVTASVLYALLFSISMVFEVAFQYDRHGTTAWLAGFLIVMPTACFGSFLGLAVTWKAVVLGRRYGLPGGVLAFSVFALLVVLEAAGFLPRESITRSELHTYPADIAFAKDALYYYPFALVFLVLPFQFVLSVQNEIAAGRHRQAIALLSEEPEGVAPRGSAFVKHRYLVGILVAIGLLSVHLTTNLFDHLEPGPFTHLFMLLIQLRTVIYFGLGAECLIWYARTLDELKREALALDQFFSSKT